MEKEKIAQGFADSPVVIVVGRDKEHVVRSVDSLLEKFPTADRVVLDEAEKLFHDHESYDKLTVSVSLFDSFDEINVDDYIILDRIIGEGGLSSRVRVVAVVGVVSSMNAVEATSMSRGMQRLVLENSLVFDSEYALSMGTGAPPTD